MIIFDKIRWKNFLSTGNSFTEVNITDAQSHLVIGANGAGTVSYTHLTLPTTP